MLFENLVRSTRKIRVTIAKNEIVKKFWNWNLPSLNFWMKCKRRVNQSLEDFIDFHYVFISSRPDNPPKGKSIKMISWGKLFDAHCSKLPLFVQKCNIKKNLVFWFHRKKEWINQSEIQMCPKWKICQNWIFGQKLDF